MPNRCKIKYRIAWKKPTIRCQKLPENNGSDELRPRVTDISHLFERFYRSEKSRNSEKGGSGIGLSIAQAVVTAHKGRISASTDDQRSLRVTAELPLA